MTLKGIKVSSLIFSLLLFAACHASSDQPLQSQSQVPEVYSSFPPFQTREPDRYQAIRTSVFTNASGESQTFKTLIAKDGTLRREETGSANGPRVVYLDLPDGLFLLLPEERIYANTTDKDESVKKHKEPVALTGAPDSSLHAGATESRYQTIGEESVGGRLAKKYRVVVNDSPAGGVSGTETLIWVDEHLGMPIRSQTTSQNGNRWVMDLTEIRQDVDKTLFQIPSGYAKVSPVVIRRELQKHR